MATVVISGGTDGIGRALAARFLRGGDTVVVLGRSREKFDALVAEAGGDAHFVAADLRSVRENLRAVAEIRDRFPVVDTLVLAAAYVHRRRVVTEEGFEHTFALYYLSRYLLATGLAPALNEAGRPLIVDTTVPGAPKDAMRWDDLQLAAGFTWKAANLQSRRAGELSGLRLGGRVRYVLYGPANLVRTSLQGDLNRAARLLTTVLVRLLGTPVERAVEPIVELIANPPEEPLTAYRGRKRLPLGSTDRDRAEAERLHTETERLLAPIRT
ncbi:SDR family NAD(P)-dependent oxidoreductase [Amycolatopsis anabasis]|uniref:SDR family NAD(P)-dependent oxidoreductase n=1 Tax=Amycolatopsis anabasis TaxID=1840409 RepID=UPI00131E0F7A|nr:SDR family NAD(P)-dependent oxidoreductase [Amycolatopsis anabasis]